MANKALGGSAKLKASAKLPTAKSLIWLCETKR